MQLSPHLSLDEMTVTSQPLLNVPGPTAINAMRDFATLVFEVVRVPVGAMRVTSGFRSAAVNKAIGGSKTSDHMLGHAADVVPLHMPLDKAWLEIVKLVEAGAPVDQAIYYYRKEGQGWIHMSHRDTPRRELLVNVGGKYQTWHTYTGPMYLP